MRTGKTLHLAVVLGLVLIWPLDEMTQEPPSLDIAEVANRMHAREKATFPFRAEFRVEEIRGGKLSQSESYSGWVAWDKKRSVRRLILQAFDRSTSSIGRSETIWVRGPERDVFLYRRIYPRSKGTWGGKILKQHVDSNLRQSILAFATLENRCPNGFAIHQPASLGRSRWENSVA